MRINDLKKMFPEYKATKTEAGAWKRLAPVLAFAPHVIHVVLQREDGLWVPIVILHHDDTHCMPMDVINCNCCVTTACRPSN